MAQDRPSQPLERLSGPDKDEPRSAKRQQVPFRKRSSGEGSQSALERLKQVEQRKAAVRSADERPLLG